MAKNWEYAAGKLWPILIAAAKERKKLTYSELAPIINTNPLSVGRALGPILFYCMYYELPPLTSIVIGKTTHIPGSGFIACDIDDIETAYEMVYQYNWEFVENPFGGFDETDTIESFSKALVEDPDKSEEIYAKVRVRGAAQVIFRAALLAAYDGECSICGLSFEEALDAAHIVPWSTAAHGERISPRNGILLCSNHHKLFDSERIQITENLVVRHVDKNYKDNYYGDADKAATIEFNNKSLRLPKNKKLWPSSALILRRNQANKR